MRRKYIQIIGLMLLLSLPLLAEDLRLDIMFTNDVHGGIDRAEATYMNPDFPPQLGGGASEATFIKQVRALSDGKTRSNLLLDAGDFFQGHPIGTVTKGRAVIDYMNQVAYDAMAVGNHDYDLGEDNLTEQIARANFPILSANLYSRKTNQPLPYVKPYIMLNKMGLKIAIIGLTTTDTEKMSFPENIKGVAFKDEKSTLEKCIQDVKSQGADLVIVLGHMGLPYDPEPAFQSRYPNGEIKSTGERYWGYDSQELAREVPGFDLLIGGHMHKGFAKPWVDPVNHALVVQGYAYGSGIGMLTLKIDPATKSITGYEFPAIREGMLVTLFEDQFIPDEEISKSISADQAYAEKGMDEVVGESAVFLSKENVDAQSLIGNTVCDALREDVNADFAFLNLGGVRGTISLGPVTYRNVFDVMPFDNQVSTFECDGKFLKKIIETRVADTRHGMIVSGVNVVYSKNRPNFDRVTSLKINGKPWDPNKIYRVATTDFLMQGNAGLTLLTQIPDDKQTNYQINLRDSIVRYFKKHSPVKTKIDDRWRRDDGSKPDAAMRAALDSIK